MDNPLDHRTALGRLREPARQYLLPGTLAALRGLAIAVLGLGTNIALFVLTVVSLVLIPAAGLGFVMFPLVAAVTRGRARLHRRLLRLSGVPVGEAYRPIPPDAPFGTWRRFRYAVTDPATWLDFAWLLPGALSGAVFGLLAVGLPVHGLIGLTVAPLLGLTGNWYGYGVFWPLDSAVKVLLTPPQGAVIFVVGIVAAPWLVWLDARFSAFFLAPTPAARLRERVDRLTATRADTVDAQAAELRRIERDLHDGAQARLVSLSMSIGLAEELMADDPAAAQALLAEARESSGQALSDLRDLVRGIHPPVLAERGLDGAVRAVALRLPVPVGVDIDLPGRPATPVETAAYFAVAEVLTNVAKHGHASVAWIRIGYGAGVLTMTVGDNGVGGADRAAGTGLRGIERRLAAFDGTMVVSSPPGGPTVVTMELPCVLSSPKTSPSSGTA